jgi:hypothetical protein
VNELEGIRRELERIRAERDRIRSELFLRADPGGPLGTAHLKGVETCALLCDIEGVLARLGKDRFCREYRTTASDLAKLIALCEDDAREAGPLVEKDAEWMGNRIRMRLI